MSESVPGPMKKRRAHRKSRTGCEECKRRRIKCDEEKPRCTHCIRHDVPCTYPGAGRTFREASVPSTASHTSPASQPASQSTSQPRSQPSPAHPAPEVRHAGIEFLTEPTVDTSGRPKAVFDLKDLALLHHWTLETSTSIVHTPQVNHFWQRIFPSIGFKSPYVIHRILSIAALHDAHLHPENSAARLHEASHYHILALSGFREDINFIGTHNSDAIFASAILAFFYAFLTFGHISRGLGDDDSTTRKSKILGAEWLPLVRGLRPVLEEVRERVLSGPLRSLLDIGDWFHLDPDVLRAPRDEQLRSLKAIWSSSADAAVYDEALLHLRTANAWMQRFQNHADVAGVEYNRDWSGPFIWVFLASDTYFTFQNQRRPEALVLFAYYGALLEQLDSYWWLQGCGKSIIGAVDECLGPYWAPWIAWPKMVVGL